MGWCNTHMGAVFVIANYLTVLLAIFGTIVVDVSLSSGIEKGVAVRFKSGGGSGVDGLDSDSSP